ncbi:MAG: hypothetical protein ACRDK1_08220 [Solirubrobacterales bacterium]
MDVFILGIIAAMVLFGLAALQWGVDSRDESDDPRRSMYPVSIN